MRLLLLLLFLLLFLLWLLLLLLLCPCTMIAPRRRHFGCEAADIHAVFRAAAAAASNDSSSSSNSSNASGRLVFDPLTGLYNCPDVAVADWVATALSLLLVLVAQIYYLDKYRRVRFATRARCM